MFNNFPAFNYLGILLCVILFTLTFKLINVNKELKYREIVLILLFSFIIYINSLIEIYSIMIILDFFIISLLMSLLFKIKLKLTFVKTIILYILGLYIGFIFLFFFTLFKINLSIFYNNIILRNLVLVLVLLNLLLLFNINSVNKFFRKVYNLLILKKIKTLNVILFLLYIFNAIILVYDIMLLEKIRNVTNILFLLFIFINFYLYNYKILISLEDKQHLLQSFIDLYEKILIKDRITQHEILNNLLILNSYEDKNSDEYSETLNEIISYYSKTNSNLKNLLMLPKGLKGIIYFKIKDLEHRGVKLVFNSSYKLNKVISKIKTSEYNRFCRLAGIFLDNAIESAIISKEKLLIVDLYIEKNDLILYLENSISKKIDMSKINKEKYSTKGRFRGLGLAIAKNIKKESKIIDYIQNISNNNHFVTILKLQF